MIAPCAGAEARTTQNASMGLPQNGGLLLIGIFTQYAEWNPQDTSWSFAYGSPKELERSVPSAEMVMHETGLANAKKALFEKLVWRALRLHLSLGTHG